MRALGARAAPAVLLAVISILLLSQDGMGGRSIRMSRTLKDSADKPYVNPFAAKFPAPKWKPHVEDSPDLITNSSKARDWASVVSACKAVINFEKRFANFMIRSTFHDSLSVDVTACLQGNINGCGGADSSVFLSLDEMTRPENSNDNFTFVAAQAVIKVASFYNTSLSDTLAVCAATAIEILSGGRVKVLGTKENKPNLRIGRLDNATPTPPNQLPADFANTQAFSSFWQARGFTLEEAVSLMGSHSLIDEQNCLRNTTIGNSCDPFTEDCSNVRMFTWDNHFYHDACTPTVKVVKEDPLFPMDYADTPIIFMAPPDITAYNQSQTCRFTSEFHRSLFWDELAKIKVGAIKQVFAVPKTYNVHWDNQNCRLGATWGADPSHCPHPQQWFYTINDAFMAETCQSNSLTDPNDIQIQSAFRKFLDVSKWDDVLVGAYLKMVTKYARWPTNDIPTYISGQECVSGFNLNATCAAQFNGKVKCPDACYPGQECHIHPCCWCKTGFENGYALTVNVTVPPPPSFPVRVPTPVAPNPDMNVAALLDPQTLAELQALENLDPATEMNLAATTFSAGSGGIPASPYLDLLDVKDSCSINGAPSVIKGFPSSTFMHTAFVNDFLMPPKLQPVNPSTSSSSSSSGGGKKPKRALQGLLSRMKSPPNSPPGSTAPGPSPTTPSAPTPTPGPAPTSSPTGGTGSSSVQPTCQGGVCMDVYQLDVSETDIDLKTGCGKPTPLLTYNGMYPGPTIEATAGRQSLLRVNNKITSTSSFYQENYPCEGARVGRPVNVHTAGQASLAPYDGWSQDGICSGETKDYVYPNTHPLTGWYHDRVLDISTDNQQHGLTGFYLVKDVPGQSQWGVENITELHMMLEDKAMDSTCAFTYDKVGVHMSSYFGDINFVNGVPFPKASLDPKQYRMRFLNAAISRAYLLFFVLDDGTKLPESTCQVIGGDGGYRSSPLNFPTHGLFLGVGERYEVVCDFTAYAGKTIWLWNARDRFRMKDVPFYCHSHLVMKINVAATCTGGNCASQSSLSTAAATPTALDAVIPADVYRGAENRVVTADPNTNLMCDKRFILGRNNGKWVIDGDTFDSSRIDMHEPLNGYEIWCFETKGTSFHYMHVSMLNMYVLARFAAPVNNVLLLSQTDFQFEMQVPKDTVTVHPGGKVAVLVRTGPHRGEYLFHDQNFVRADGEMMRSFRNGYDASADIPTTDPTFGTLNGLMTGTTFDNYKDPMYTAAAATTSSVPLATAVQTVLTQRPYRVFYPVQSAGDPAALCDKNTNPWLVNCAP